MNDSILEVKNLNTWFYTDDKLIKAVQDVSFNLNKGEILGIVGESGCGKSVMAKSIMNLVEKPGEIVSGKIIYDDKEIQNLNDKDLRKIRGKDIAYVIQNPMSSFNPVHNILKHICDSIRIHEKISKKDAIKRAIKLLDMVGINNAEEISKKYPHQFSGGMLQRAAIAMAISCNPKVLIADEPTTSLDVSMQSQILDLLRRLKKELGMSVIVITHDFGVVWDICEKIMVVYAGEIVELASVYDLYNNPMHPYTKALLKSMINMDTNKNNMLETIKGTPVNLQDIKKGCSFVSRCSNANEECRVKAATLKEVKKNHYVRCNFIIEGTKNEK